MRIGICPFTGKYGLKYFNTSRAEDNYIRLFVKQGKDVQNNDV